MQLLTLNCRVQLTPVGSKVNLEPFQYDPLEEERDALGGNGVEGGALNGERYWDGNKLGRKYDVITDGLAEKEAGIDEPLSVEWRAERMETPFGITDDVVTLRSGKTYHFFRLPHKVQYVPSAHTLLCVCMCVNTPCTMYNVLCLTRSSPK